MKFKRFRKANISKQVGRELLGRLFGQIKEDPKAAYLETLVN